MTKARCAVFGVLLALSATLDAAGELLYAPEGNRLRRYDLEGAGRGAPLAQDVLIERAELDPLRGRDINGMVCLVPDGSGRFVAGEDSGQPHPPPGWGVFEADGTQVGKLTPSTYEKQGDPYGCAFDAQGRLFTTEAGKESLGGGNGQLIVWFPPFDRFPGPPGSYPKTDATSEGGCKLATDLGLPLGLAIDREGRVYVAEASGREVARFSPPFPTGPDAAGGCGARDALGSPKAERVQRERFLGPLARHGILTYAGLAFAPNRHLYASSVATGRIAEFDGGGRFVRLVLKPSGLLPPFATGSPQGLAVDARGDLYYTDLDLHLRWSGIDTGPDGKLWRIRFDAQGAPQPPEPLARGLEYPDGLGILPGSLRAPGAR